MNKARRESLKSLNADPETLNFFAGQEQRQVQGSSSSPLITGPISITNNISSGSGNNNNDGSTGSGNGSAGTGTQGGERFRSKSLVYGLSWAQAMNGRPVQPSQQQPVFGITAMDDLHWNGPWIGPGGGGGGGGGNAAAAAGTGAGATPTAPAPMVPAVLAPGTGTGTGAHTPIQHQPARLGMPTHANLSKLSVMEPDPRQRSMSPATAAAVAVAGQQLMRDGVATPTVHSWEPTLEKAIRAIVSITANHVRSFDTETSGAYSATGFLVDAERGIILSNRHVVSPAPILALAILSNYEEVELKPIYRDPVHDFGFLQFDTSKVRFMNLEEITLSPERAKVGLDIRVVGNDAGEKLSIMAGTLARLDRKTPDYGQGEYNDFNTFYLQAASSTSGGSSGSPVLDIEGHAVALNAGGATKASASYYLPLDRVKRALKFIQLGMAVPRGTLQTEFEYFPYDELRRLGLKLSLEEKIRKIFPNETGMLVVKTVLPKGPAADKLVPGDIIIECNGEPIANFIHLFSVLDDSVNQKVTLTLVRGSGSALIKSELLVQDLHSITPDRFVEIGGGVVNELSYQLAHSYGQPCGGVYVATSGHMLASASAWRKSIIVGVNNIPTPNLEAFIKAIGTLPDGARVPIRFYSLQKAYKEKIMIMHVDRHWHKCRLAIRNDTTGIWDFTDLDEPPPSHPYNPATATYPTIDASLYPAPVVMPSFVAIDFHLPFLVDGMKATQFYGTGLVVSTNPPLVLCDRDTIPIAIGDIFITFANSIIIPGRLVYLHPQYNFCVLTYDATLLGNTPVKAATFCDKPLTQGESCWLIGVGTDQSPVIKKTTVSNVGNIGTRECSPPRWRAMNVEGIKVDDPVGTQGGVLCNQDGAIQALWVNYSSQDEKGKDITFMSGLDVAAVHPVIDPFMRGEYPKIRGLDVEFWTMRIAAARSLGLTDAWVQKIESDPTSRHSLLYVLSLLDASSPCSQALRVGDVILDLEGKVATGMRDLERAMKVESVNMTVLREGKELSLVVPTVPMRGTETNRILGWAGALIQMPYKAVLEQVSNIPTGVYVSCTLYGSPASTALRPGVWITEVDGIAVSDLDEFLAAVRRHETRVVRCRQGSVVESALKRLSLEGSKWKRIAAEALQQERNAAHKDNSIAEHPIIQDDPLGVGATQQPCTPSTPIKITGTDNVLFDSPKAVGTPNTSQPTSGGPTTPATLSLASMHPHDVLTEGHLEVTNVNVNNLSFEPVTPTTPTATLWPIPLEDDEDEKAEGLQHVVLKSGQRTPISHILLHEDGLEIMGTPDPNAEDDAAQGQGYVRIKTISRTEVTNVVAMKLDPHYWGTWQLTRDPTNVSGWRSSEIV